MLKASEILLETIKKDGRPERLLRQYEGATFYPPNPANNYVRGNRHRGMEPMKDLFGTEILWPQEQLAAMPHVTEDNKVIDDITEWKEQLVIPDIVGQCSDPALWEPFKQKAQEIKDSGSLFMAFMPTGVFERLHFLMGFEDMLVNFLLEPEDMMDLCNAIGEYRFQLTKLIVDNLHPDIILSHDDWGSKQSLFISPDTWREFIKPQYERSYKYMKDHGVIVMHHADSFMEPIIEDMVDLGIDIWQGTLPENAKEEGFMADGEAARASGGDNGCPPFIFAFLPIFWEQDLKGAGRTMVDGPNYRWQFLVSYPEGHKEDGDQWMMNEVLPAFAAMPEVTRMMTSKVKKEINNCHMDRCVEMWFDGPEEWYHCAVENTASFKKPEWAEYDNFPYLRPQFQFASLFLTDIATSDNLKQYRGYLPMR